MKYFLSMVAFAPSESESPLSSESPMTVTALLGTFFLSESLQLFHLDFSFSFSLSICALGGVSAMNDADESIGGGGGVAREATKRLKL